MRGEQGKASLLDLLVSIHLKESGAIEESYVCFLKALPRL